MSNDLELRMYFFVPYQLTPIQKGIQAGHAALEYVKEHGTIETWNFIDKHKTWIILDGGTTNNSVEVGANRPIGTLNQIRNELINNQIPIGDFFEPDFNNALTAVCFICDERVWNYEDYPDFEEHLAPINPDMLSDEDFNKGYFLWMETLGGKKNVFLRQLIRDKRLAT